MVNPERPIFLPKRWTDEQWKVACAPHRPRIIAVMDGLGEATASEVAELTGRSVSSLYRHLDELADAGFLTKRKAERGGRRQTVYGRGPALDVPPVDPDTGDGCQWAAEFLRLMFHEFGGQVGRFYALLGQSPGPAGMNHPGSRRRFYSELTWLTDAEQQRVVEHIEAIRVIAKEGRDRRVGQRTQLVLCAFRDVSMSELRGVVSDPPPGAPASTSRPTDGRSPR